MIFLKMTPEGSKNLKGLPESIDGALDAFKKMGGHLIGFYACGALYDFIGIGEMPKAEIAEMFRRLIASWGGVEAQVIRLYTKEEFGSLIEAIELDS